jgi:hypothetical protein
VFTRACHESLSRTGSNCKEQKSIIIVNKESATETVNFMEQQNKLTKIVPNLIVILTVHE